MNTDDPRDTQDISIVLPSSLFETEKTLKKEGRFTEAKSESDMVGTRPRDNEIFQKEYVKGAYELAEMLGILDKGSPVPTKGLSFRAKNYKYYDFIDYWMAMVNNIKLCQDTNDALTKGYLAQEDFLDAVDDSLKSYKTQLNKFKKYLIGIGLSAGISLILSGLLYFHTFT